MRLPPIDYVCARVHGAWVKEKRDAGVTTRPSALSGKEQLVDWDQLDEKDKESNRLQVKTVYDAIEAYNAGT
jgi:hypothetical protein